VIGRPRPREDPPVTLTVTAKLYGGPVWSYGWQATHTGHRRACSKEECGPGCPDKHRPRPTPGPRAP
jgi:hypothetical protein